MSAMLRHSPRITRRKLYAEETSHEQVGYFKEFTVVVFGDAGVGKSSIIRQLVAEEYIHEHVPTVEEFYVKQINHKNKACELHIIDTSGTYEFPAMRRIAIQKADAAVVVYSVDKPESVPKLDRYMQEIESCSANSNRKIPVIIVSNKSDIPNLSEPTFYNPHGMKVSASVYLESKWKCQWLATSAKFKLNVDQIFLTLLDKLSPEKKLQRSHNVLSMKHKLH